MVLNFKIDAEARNQAALTRRAKAFRLWVNGQARLAESVPVRMAFENMPVGPVYEMTRSEQGKRNRKLRAWFAAALDKSEHVRLGQWVIVDPETGHIKRRQRVSK